MNKNILLFSICFMVLVCFTQFVGWNPKSHAPSPKNKKTDAKAERRTDLSKLHDELFSKQTKARLNAARQLGEVGDSSSIPLLIDALADTAGFRQIHMAEPGMGTVRYWANDSLKRLTKKDFEYDWEAPPSMRDAAILKWRRWYRAKQQSEKFLTEPKRTGNRDEKRSIG
jgi:hypothetical protein